MGVIRKKTITRGTEGGLKYICDICSADITATVCAVESDQTNATKLSLLEAKLIAFPRFGYVAMSAPNTICVYHASEMQLSREITTLQHMHFL